MSKLPIQFEWHGPSPAAYPDRVLVPVSTPGVNGPNTVSDLTTLGTLSGITDPAFLLVGAAAGDAARKLTPTPWGLSTLLASVPAGRVPFSNVTGAVTSNAGLSYNAVSGGLSVNEIVSTPELIFTIGANKLYGVQSSGFIQGSGRSYGWTATAGPASGTRDTEMNRNATGFVGLGSTTNKVVVGHNNTVGRISTGGPLFLSGYATNPTVSGTDLDVRFGYITDSRYFAQLSQNGTGGRLTLRDSSGNTDMMRVEHNGTDGVFSSLSGRVRMNASNGVYTFRDTGNADALNFKLNGQCQISMVSGGNIGFTSSATDGFNGVDTRIRRSSANTLDLDTGTNDAFASMRLRGLTATDAPLTVTRAGGTFHTIVRWPTRWSGITDAEITNFGGGLVTGVTGLDGHTLPDNTTAIRLGNGVGAFAFVGHDWAGPVIWTSANKLRSPLTVQFRNSADSADQNVTLGNLTASGSAIAANFKFKDSTVDAYWGGGGADASLIMSGGDVLKFTRSGGGPSGVLTVGNSCFFDVKVASNSYYRIMSATNSLFSAGNTGSMTFASVGSQANEVGIGGATSTLGFYGVTAVARPTLPDAGTVTAADIRTALISLGLCQ